MYKNELNSRSGYIKQFAMSNIFSEKGGVVCLMLDEKQYRIPYECIVLMESAKSVQIAVALKLLVIFQANSSTFSPYMFSLVNGAK